MFSLSHQITGDDEGFPSTSNYYDPAIYNKLNVAYQTNTLLIGANTANFYRRKYTNFVLGAAGTFTTSTIQITHDLDAASAYTRFEAPTRMSVARAASPKTPPQPTAIETYCTPSMV